MIALYIRLSDADSDIGEEKEESNSVSNQREFLRDYVKTHPEWKDEKVEEFVDDGYSGMNFNRPAFQRMLTLIKQREVTTVIVKDFSRFGRDYIEVGDYMERYFPFLGVRFIALNEEYDSDRRESNGDQDMSIVMKNILNAYYSKDLSQKITSTIRKRTENGEFVYAARPFGYIIDPVDERKVVIDPVAGPYVRLIFDLAIQGKNSGSIARILNEKRIPTCLEYNRQSKIKGKTLRPASKDANLWKHQQVTTILKNDFYCGVYVSGKYRRAVAGHKKMRRLREDEVVRIENHHPKIVTPEEFRKSQEVIRVTKHANSPSSRSGLELEPLLGKVRCANCGRAMSRHNRTVIGSFYLCPLFYQLKEGIGCTQERYNEAELEGMVLRELKAWFQVLVHMEIEIQQKNKERMLEIMKIQDQIHRLEIKRKEIQRKKVVLYERYSEGVLDAAAFVPEREALSARMKEYEAEIEFLGKEVQKLRGGKTTRQNEYELLMIQVRMFHEEEKLTRAMTEAFLDKVVITDPSHMEIVWLWQDLVDEICEEGGL